MFKGFRVVMVGLFGLQWLPGDMKDVKCRAVCWALTLRLVCMCPSREPRSSTLLGFVRNKGI